MNLLRQHNAKPIERTVNLWHSALVISAGVIMLLFYSGSVRSAPNSTYTISAAGIPRLYGNHGGSIIGSSTIGQDLAVTIDFGEVSPINRNPVVTAVIPVAIRARDAYEVEVAVAGQGGSRSLCDPTVRRRLRCPELSSTR